MVGPAALENGGVVAQKYRLERKIGEGGMSEVWAATDLERGIRVALKMLLPSAAENPEIVARFRREAELLGRLESPHVPHLYDFLEDPTHGRILVEELVQGELLARVLQQRHLSIPEARALGIGLGRAVRELHHAGIIHRDLKPANVILEPLPGFGQRAVLIDFGVSRLHARSERDGEDPTDALTEITQAGRGLGTITFMAPEQLLGANVGQAVDLYSIGAILYRAVAGHHVFGELHGMELARVKLLREAPPLVTGCDDPIARGLEAVVARTLRRQPEQRYQSADELLAELLALGPEGVAAAPPDCESDALAPVQSSVLADEPPAPSVEVVVAPRQPAAVVTRPAFVIALAAGILVGAAIDRQLTAPRAAGCASGPAQASCAQLLPAAEPDWSALGPQCAAGTAPAPAPVGGRMIAPHARRPLARRVSQRTEPEPRIPAAGANLGFPLDVMIALPPGVGQ